MSEFHMDLHTVLFGYTLPQLRLLARARIERNDMSEARRKAEEKGGGNSGGLSELLSKTGGRL